MNVRAIAWTGVHTPRFDEMRTLLEALLGAPPVSEEGFALWDLPSGDLVELFAQGRKPEFGSAPVVGLLVDDLSAACRSIEAAGGEIVGGYGPNADGYQAVHFRAPDGNVYEVVRDPKREHRARRRAEA